MERLSHELPALGTIRSLVHHCAVSSLWGVHALCSMECSPYADAWGNASLLGSAPGYHRTAARKAHVTGRCIAGHDHRCDVLRHSRNGRRMAVPGRMRPVAQCGARDRMAESSAGRPTLWAAETEVLMADAGSAPVRLGVEYPEQLSRLHLLLKVFLGWLYVCMPHGIILALFSYLTLPVACSRLHHRALHRTLPARDIRHHGGLLRVERASGRVRQPGDGPVPAVRTHRE